MLSVKPTPQPEVKYVLVNADNGADDFRSIPPLTNTQPFYTDFTKNNKERIEQK